MRTDGHDQAYSRFSQFVISILQTEKALTKIRKKSAGIRRPPVEK